MRENRKIKKIFFIILLLVLSVSGVWAFIIFFEGNQPDIVLDMTSLHIGASNDFSGVATDEGQGLKKILITVLKDGKETELFKKEFDAQGILRSSGVFKENIQFKFEPKKLNLKDGKGILRISVWDYSLRSWLNGNTKYIQKDIVIDSIAPEIEILTRSHNISQGGSGLIIYRIDESGSHSGVVVGDNYFPGYKGLFSDENIYMSFFALGHNQNRKTSLFVKAVDMAGNSSKSNFPYYIKQKKYRKDTIKLSDNFLNDQIPGLALDETLLKSGEIIDQYLEVNGKGRDLDGKKIMNSSKKSENSMHWKGIFKRLPGSATRAKYADFRTYIYKGNKVDKQYHMGIDLASVKHAKVPAANNGKVVLTDNIGIYGKTVVIDHGFGLMSAYSHLSNISVHVNDVLKKGDFVGETGMTGLTGGDHLHYSMFIMNTFVNPIEWWDKEWIKNNVTDKIEYVRKEFK